jgi:hypothetical protein
MGVLIYRSPTTAMAHQLRAVAASRAAPPVPSGSVFAYLMDMGTGKSKVVLDEFGEDAVSGGPLDLLIFGPAGSYRNWFEDKSELQPSELNRHVDPAFLNRLVWVPWISGGGKRLRERIRAMMECRDKRLPRALFVNIEAVQKRDEAFQLCMDFVAQRRARVVIDESTTIRGNSNRADNVIEIGRASASKRIMSGLWTPRSPLDLYNQCMFLDRKILGRDNIFSFKMRYAITKKVNMGGTYVSKDGEEKKRKPFNVTLGWRHIEELRERVAPYRFRVLKKDCLDLVPKTYTIREVELTKEQKKMIEEIRLFGHAAVGDSFVTVDMVLKQIIRLAQIGCGYVMDDERVLREVPENRTDELIALLDEHAGKAIIWCPWRAPVQKIVDRIKKEYGPGSVAQFHGGNKNTRGDEERRFLGDPACKYMVATQGAGMRGNTWICADLTVYYANSYDLEQRDQSEDRNHRVGQRNPVTVVDLVARDTNDMKVLKNLRKKIDMATLINNEGYREWIL